MAVEGGVIVWSLELRVRKYQKYSSGDLCGSYECIEEGSSERLEFVLQLREVFFLVFL